MKKKAIDTILDFINKYRAVTFGALRMNYFVRNHFYRHHTPVQKRFDFLRKEKAGNRQHGVFFRDL